MAASSDPVNVLSSLDRDASGNVTDAQIEVGRRNLSVTTPVSAQNFGGGDIAPADVTDLINGSTVATVVGDDTATIDGSKEASIGDGASEVITIGQVSEGDSFQVDLGDVPVNVAGGGTATGERTFEFVAGANDGTADVAQNLTSQISAFFEAATDSSLNLSATVSGNQITITNGPPESGTNSNLLIGLRAQTGGTAGATAASGGLGALQNVDVTTDSGATGALNAIEGLIQKSVDAAAAFGSAEGRISTQSDFVGKLTDSLTSGIGSLVDANMEEASARLQALQVQQQLGRNRSRSPTRRRRPCCRFSGNPDVRGARAAPLTPTPTHRSLERTSRERNPAGPDRLWRTDGTDPHPARHGIRYYRPHHARPQDCRRKTGGHPALAAAIHDNRRLWTLLAADVATESNPLPRELRARILYLAEFTRVHSGEVLRNGASVEPLVEVNTAVMRGLADRAGAQ